MCNDCILSMYLFFFFKQKTAYDMRISDWSSDVCSSDLCGGVSSGGSAIHTDRIGGIPDDMAKYREVLREAPNTQCIVYRATHNPRQGYTYTWSGYTGTPVPVVYPMETPFRVTVDLGQ